MIDQDGGKADFDFHALSILKRREKLKVVILTIVIVLLVITLLVVSILYHKELNKEEIIGIIPRSKLAQTKAYKQISKYGEDCSSTSKNHTECGANAYCRYLQGTFRCDCKLGFVGDGIGDCKDVNFAINFKVRTTKNIPKLQHVHFPRTDGLSFCFWFKLAELTSKWNAAFLYTSVKLPGSNDLMLWFNNQKQLHVSMRDKHQLVLKQTISLHVWTHLCWTWNNTGSWSIYISGKKRNFKHNDSKTSFVGTFPDSQGTLILGQDKDKDIVNDPYQMYRGEITQFYIYHKQLTDDEVYSVFQSHPLTKKIVVGWWQFKNKTKGTDIVESKIPKELIMLEYSS